MLPSLGRTINKTSKSIFLIANARSFSYTPRLLWPNDPVNGIGHWPRTEAERLRAARKYNLIPEDYEPHDELDGFGDYPKLKDVGAFNRDWYEDFDDPYDLMNYGEPLHKHWDLYQFHRINPLEHEIPDWPLWVKFTIFVVSLFAFPVMWLVSKRYKLYVNQPWKQRSAIAHQQTYEFPEGFKYKLPHH